MTDEVKPIAPNMPAGYTDNPLYDGVEEAESGAQFAEKHSFGKLTITTVYFRFEAGRPALTRAEYKKAKAAKEAVGMEYAFSVNIQEFSAKAKENGWTYERKVRPGSVDWLKVVAPAIEAIYGPGSMDPKPRADGTIPMIETLTKLNGQYVDVIDIPQAKNADFSVPKLAKVFKDAAECKTAHDERYTKREQASGAQAAAIQVPPGWKAQAWQGLVPTIKAELAAGNDPASVADGYGVPAEYVEALK